MPDIARDPAILKRKRLRQAGLGAIVLVILVAVSVQLARMEPAAPSVERATVLEDTVKRGSIVRQVRGVGTLVPEDTRWLPATTEGRVERILLRPGANVKADSVILVLSNPQVEQEAINARLALQSSRAGLDNLRAQLQNELLTQEALAASIESDFEQARMEAQANEALAKEELVSDLILKQSQIRAQTLKNRVAIEGRRLTAAREGNEARLRVQQASVDQAQAMVDLSASRLKALQVTPGFSGVLQQVPVEVGQRVGPGQNLARVADPGRLKAELRVAETEARDIEVGQPAEVDTRSGVVAGRVSRKDPAAANGTVTIDVSMTGELPRGAVPDMSVDGTVQLQRLEDVLYVGRPSLGQDNSTAGLFRVVDADGNAQRVQVKFGLSSVNAIVVLSGLKEGDRVVLSDMSSYDSYDRVRLR
ncbi:MAG TPA: HlyD family efflux transporter periplasmic adaptor subunit [Vicinamibacterales bacterium]|nr:HlyD family efflux transporter periplasmic adaptor subunit [Vicinamibacterales bacterium]